MGKNKIPGNLFRGTNEVHLASWLMALDLGKSSSPRVCAEHGSAWGTLGDSRHRSWPLWSRGECG